MILKLNSAIQVIIVDVCRIRMWILHWSLCSLWLIMRRWVMWNGRWISTNMWKSWIARVYFQSVFVLRIWKLRWQKNKWNSILLWLIRIHQLSWMMRRMLQNVLPVQLIFIWYRISQVQFPIWHRQSCWTVISSLHILCVRLSVASSWNIRRLNKLPIQMFLVIMHVKR